MTEKTRQLLFWILVLLGFVTPPRVSELLIGIAVGIRLQDWISVLSGEET